MESLDRGARPSLAFPYAEIGYCLGNCLLATEDRGKHLPQIIISHRCAISAAEAAPQVQHCRAASVSPSHAATRRPRRFLLTDIVKDESDIVDEMLAHFPRADASIGARPRNMTGSALADLVGRTLQFAVGFAGGDHQARAAD